MTTTHTGPDVGAAAPDLQLSASDGTTTQMSALWKERPVALIFLHATDGPHAVEVATQWRDSRAVVEAAGGVVAAICSEDVAGARAFEERWNLGYPLLSDRAVASYRAYGVTTELPGSFVVDTEGGVRFAHRNGQPLDNPPTWALIDTISGLTGRAVERPEVTPFGQDVDEDGAAADDVAPFVPLPGASIGLDFTCAKCANKSYEVLDVSTSSGMLSRMVNLQNRRFSAVVCQQCKYVEFYQTQAGALRNIADLLIGS